LHKNALITAKTAYGQLFHLNPYFISGIHPAPSPQCVKGAGDYFYFKKKGRVYGTNFTASIIKTLSPC
jgi:hypothetical protein